MKVIHLLLPVVMVTTSTVPAAACSLNQGFLPLALTHDVAGQTEPRLHTFASNPSLKQSAPGFRTFLDELSRGSVDGTLDEYFNGYTPLHRAALAGNFDVAFELVKMNVNRDLVVSDHASCLEHHGKKACELVPLDTPHAFVLRWLLEDGLGA